MQFSWLCFYLKWLQTKVWRKQALCGVNVWTQCAKGNTEMSPPNKSCSQHRVLTFFSHAGSPTKHCLEREVIFPNMFHVVLCSSSVGKSQKKSIFWMAIISWKQVIQISQCMCGRYSQKLEMEIFPIWFHSLHLNISDLSKRHYVKIVQY